MNHHQDQPGPVLGTEPILPTATLDGVPVLWGPHPDGEYAAGLVFRVGRADETLATSGITHLVEHLALHEHGMSDLHYNGTTADLFTHFFVHGTEEHVTEYLHGVCAGLRNLPVQRMETEKRLLANEAEGRSGGSSVLYRHGAQGHGLAAYPELGLHGLGPDQVRAWAARHFTAGNAALWISGEKIPPGLRLDLPEGPRVAPPALTSALPTTPAWFGARGNALVASGLLPRDATAQVFAQVLDRALFRDLRQRDGISYRAGTDYSPLDRDTAVVWAIADCAPEHRAALVGAYADTVARLRFRGPTETELSAAIEAVTKGLRDPSIESHRLPSLAHNLLLDRPSETTARLLAESEAVTVDDVRAMAQRFHDTSLVQVPSTGLSWAGHERAPDTSLGEPVAGRTLAVTAPGGVELVAGSDGITRHVEGDAHATVRFGEVAAMLRYPDGGRELIGLDGVRVAVEPTLTKVPADVTASIDHAVPTDRVVPMPRRDPSEMPRLQVPQGKQPEPTALRWLRGIVAMVLLLLALPFAITFVGFLADQDWGNAVAAAVIGGVLAGGAYWIGGPVLPRRKGRAR